MTTTSFEHRRLSAGTFPNYANEGDPSWEEVVAMVVIPGNPSGIYEAAGQWDLLFSRVRQVQTAIDELKTGLESWEGEAGDAYRNHLAELSGRITQVIDTSSGLPNSLRTAADHVANTLNNTPIPDELVSEAMDAREQFLATGELNHRFHNGFFFDTLLPSFMGPASEILSAGLGFLDALPGMGAIRDKASDMLRDFLSDGDDQAISAYRSLSGQHQSTAGMIGSGSVHATGPDVETVTPSMPPTGTMPPASGPGTGSMPGLGGAGGAPGIEPSDWNNSTGTGLAGAGGGGPVAVGGASAGAGGLGGIGSGVGAGGGLGGVGGGTAGAGGVGGVGMTPGARPGGMTSAASAIRGGAGAVPMMGAAGAGAGAGRGGGARGAGAGGAGRGTGGVPMMGGAAGGAGARGAGAGKGVGGGPPGVASRVAGGAAGAGGRGMVGGMAPGAAGAAGEGSDHSTWLNEDEDVWGVDSDAPPPVVG